MKESKEELQKIVYRVNVNQVDKKQKGVRSQISVKLNDERRLRVEQWERQSGLKAARIFQKFIDEGEVNVRYDAKKVSATLADIHNKINDYSLKVRDDCAELKRTFSRIEKEVGKNYVNALAMEALLINAEFLTEHMLQRYRETREMAEMEMKEHVNIYGGE